LHREKHGAVKASSIPVKENFWHQNPFVSGFVVSGGVVLSVLSLFFLLDGVPDAAEKVTSLQLRIALGVLLWVLGCGMVSRTRFGSWTRGFICSLFLLPGLLYLIYSTGGHTRQEMWQQSNPDLARRQNRRQYRDIKPLY
jgi:hypothetical protein